MAAFEVGKTSFKVDISEILKSLDMMDQIPHSVLGIVAREIETRGRELLISVFDQAISTQSEESFPEEFQDHVDRILAHAPFQRTVGSTTFEVSFDFNNLGDRSDLERAFHQGARLKDGSKLDGPYTGQPLAESDPATRHIYWEAVRKGQQFAPNPKRPGKIPVPEGAWEETKRKYVEIWGEKAPEWLYLEFGQNAWEPKIHGFPIIETFSAEFNTLSSDLFGSIVAAQIEAASQSGAALTPFGARLINPTDELGPSGRRRQVGQFYPLRR